MTIDLFNCQRPHWSPDMRAEIYEEARKAALDQVDVHVQAVVGMKIAEHDGYVAELRTQIETLEDQRDELQTQINAMWAQLNRAHSDKLIALAERDDLRVLLQEQQSS